MKMSFDKKTLWNGSYQMIFCLNKEIADGVTDRQSKVVAIFASHCDLGLSASLALLSC